MVKKPRVWRPRGGSKLPTGWNPPNRLQRQLHSVISRIPRRLLHPVWGIVVATLLAISGRSELFLHSYGLLFAGLWLIVDLWAWLLDKHSEWGWRFVIGAGCSSLLLIVVMAIVWWWMNGKLQDQQDDVLSRMVLIVNPPRENGSNALMVSVTNNGRTTIAQHSITCEWIYARFKNGEEVKHATSSVEPPAQVLGSYGGSDSSPCMTPLHIDTGVLFCADFVAMVTYELETQPGVKWFKRSRYWMKPSGDMYPMPLESAGYFCQ